jgi:hypothetical protein
VKVTWFNKLFNWLVARNKQITTVFYDEKLKKTPTNGWPPERYQNKLGLSCTAGSILYFWVNQIMA